jgi:hypothetical protein
MSSTPVSSAAAVGVENISLYIPYMKSDITGDKIAEVFLQQDFGYVRQVDLVPKLNKKGEYYHSAFVHFDYWFDNIAVQNFQERLRDSNKLTRVVYDDPYFWTVLENKSEKRVPGKPKMRIDLSDLKPRQLDPEFVAVIEDDIENGEPDTVTAVVDVAYLAYLENEVRELREKVSTLSALSTF